VACLNPAVDVIEPGSVLTVVGASIPQPSNGHERIVERDFLVVGMLAVSGNYQSGGAISSHDYPGPSTSIRQMVAPSWTSTSACADDLVIPEEPLSTRR
jgi:hypothetical protein